MVGVTGISLSSEELKTQDVEQNEKLDSTTNMFTNAAAATDKEHKMTLWQGCKLYPKAILWSVLISSCCAMEGYDISLVGNFYAFDPFNRKYGVQGADGTYQVPARWQTGLSNGAQCGQILGLIGGWPFLVIIQI
ncbi:hypothetical protein AYX13_06975 [Cryptococcus neoformans]|nr:hypothetical protein AYX13_06975 [Cryptococcus neoformans var. grubii]